MLPTEVVECWAKFSIESQILDFRYQMNQLKSKFTSLDSALKDVKQFLTELTKNAEQEELQLYADSCAETLADCGPPIPGIIFNFSHL